MMMTKEETQYLERVTRWTEIALLGKLIHAGQKGFESDDSMAWWAWRMGQAMMAPDNQSGGLQELMLKQSKAGE